MRGAVGENDLDVVLVPRQRREEARGEGALLPGSRPRADDLLDELGDVGAKEARKDAHGERLRLRAALARGDGAHDGREAGRRAGAEERVAACIGPRDSLQHAEEVREVRVVDATAARPSGGAAAAAAARGRDTPCSSGTPLGREAEALAGGLPARRRSQVARRRYEEARDGGRRRERLESGLGAAEAVERSGRACEDSRKACQEGRARLAHALPCGGGLGAGEVKKLLGATCSAEGGRICARHLLQEIHGRGKPHKRLGARACRQLARPPVPAHGLEDLRRDGALQERRHRARDRRYGS